MTIAVSDLIWESPRSELDATIVWLDRAPDNVDLPDLVASEPQPIFEESTKRRFFIIHYPLGGQLAISLHDNTQVGWEYPRLHYRTQTESGSSGSPVFDEHWKLVALHRAGDTEMPRLDGRPGMYEANEGIWMHAILQEAGKCPPRSAPVRSKPVVAPPNAAPTAAPAAQASASIAPARSDLVFVSYCREDKKSFGELELFLKPLARANRLRKWTDQDIPTGSDWITEIRRALDESRVAVLLVTQQYLASDFIDKEEFPRVLEAAATRGLKIFWVAVDHASVKDTPLADIQAANDPARPLRGLKQSERNKFWVELAEKIQRAASV